MRGRDAIAVALRHPDGRIVTATERLDSGFHGNRASRWPFVRGLVVLYETLVVGTRWLVRSASLSAAEEGVELGRGAIALMLALTLGIGIGIFFLVPLLLASATAGSNQNGLVQHLVEGLIRVGLFVGYLLLIAQAPDVRRVFQYHGAEHMSIHALEAGDPLIVANVRKYPTAHQRCGTEFLVIVVASEHHRVQPGRAAGSGRHGRQPRRAHPGHRGRRLRDPPLGRPPSEQPARPRDPHARHLGPDDHDPPAHRRHDRGRHRLARGGSQGRRRGRPRGQCRLRPGTPGSAGRGSGRGTAAADRAPVAAVEAAIEAAADLPAGVRRDTAPPQDRSSMEGSSMHEFPRAPRETAGHDRRATTRHGATTWHGATTRHGPRPR